MARTASAPVNATPVSPKLLAAKAKLAEINVARIEAIEYAKAHPVKATGIAATLGFAIFGAYRAISEVIG